MNTLIVLALAAVIILFLGVLNLKNWILPVAIAGFILALGLNLDDWGASRAYFSNMLITDNFSVSFGSLIILSALFVMLLSFHYYKNQDQAPEGIYSIILFSVIGALVMISSGNLVNFFIGLEIMSISLYLLAGSEKKSIASNEAAMKYFLMGSFASAFLLFGIALLFGATGSLYFHDIAQYSITHVGSSPLIFKAGVLLVALGMSFKVGAVPFHFWVPDVYQGSPAIITTFMITAIKVAGFAAFLRLTNDCFPGDNAIWSGTLAIIAASSIIVGNLAAIGQPSAKRMLAYSSIAHTGYLLIAIVCLQANSSSVILFYSYAYVFANLGAFAILIALRESAGNTSLDSLNGLGKLNKLSAIAFTIAMLSLTGIPPLAGFMAKYNLFALAIQHGYLWLVIIAILGSVVSIFYYFRPIINIYMKPADIKSLNLNSISTFTIILITLFSLVLGFIPGWIMSWI
jgi:NADH-quinone oxidoreductase subunit N